MDLVVSEFVFEIIGRWAWLDGLIVFFAKFLPYLMVGAFLFFIFKIDSWPRKLYFIFFTFLAAVLSRGLFTEIIRFFYVRPRPFETLGAESLLAINEPAFPSAHAAFFFALAFSLWFFNRRWSRIFVAASLINGLARIGSGVHWLSDIFGGILVAFLAVWSVNIILKKFSPK